MDSKTLNSIVMQTTQLHTSIDKILMLITYTLGDLHVCGQFVHVLEQNIEIVIQGQTTQ